MATPTDFMTLFGIPLIRQYLAEERDAPGSTLDPVRGCWLTRPRSGDGYYKPTLKTRSALARESRGLRGPYPDGGVHGTVTVLFHRMALVSALGRNILPNHQASHLCDEPNCFRPSHLIEETGERNRSRKTCIQIRCPHHGYPWVYDTCTHPIKCMKRPPPPDLYHCCGLGTHHSSDDASSSSLFLEEPSPSCDSDIPTEYESLPPGSVLDESSDEGQDGDTVMASSPPPGLASGSSSRPSSRGGPLSQLGLGPPLSQFGPPMSHFPAPRSQHDSDFLPPSGASSDD